MYWRLKCHGVAALASLPVLLTAFQTLSAAPLAMVNEVEWQPLAAQVRRLIEATDYLGSPLGEKAKTALEAALNERNSQAAIGKVQTILDARCLFGVQINPEMRVKVAQG